MSYRPFPRRARIVSAGAAATCGILVAASPAFAHTEFDLDEVAPGSVVTLDLFVENESDTAGTTMVELRFPEPLVVVELPTIECWTAEPVDGAIGEAAIGIVWTRPSAHPDEDPNLPLTIGPLPDIEGRLQFKVVQTYSDGAEEAWIDEWPEGAEEPPHPGPILDLVEGAPGTLPAETDETTVDVSVSPTETTESATIGAETTSDVALTVADASAAPDASDSATC